MNVRVLFEVRGSDVGFKVLDLGLGILTRFEDYRGILRILTKILIVKIFNKL